MTSSSADASCSRRRGGSRSPAAVGAHAAGSSRWWSAGLADAVGIAAMYHIGGALLLAAGAGGFTGAHRLPR